MVALRDLDKDELIEIVLRQEYEIKKQKEANLLMTDALSKMIETNLSWDHRFTQVVVWGMCHSEFVDKFKKL